MRATRNSRAPQTGAGLAHLLHLLLDRLAEPFQFDQQHGRGIHRVAGVGGLFHHAQHHAVEHLDRDRGDGAGGDLGHGAAGVLVRFVDGQSGLDHLGLAHQPDGDRGDQHHGAFGAGQQAGEIVARQVGLLAAGLDHGAVGQHQLQAEDVIGGDAVGQGVRAAGVFRDVAADGAGALAGGVGRVEIAAALHRQGDVQVDHAGLHHGALVFQIDFEDPVHAREGDHDAALAGDGAAGESGAGAAADERHVELAARV